MSKKNKINIPGFGERYCSSNSEYKLFDNGNFYIFFKKGTYILHNEYGPAKEHLDGSYEYLINGLYHRLSGLSFLMISHEKYQTYDLFGRQIGENECEFIKNLTNVLIPKNILLLIKK